MKVHLPLFQATILLAAACLPACKSDTKKQTSQTESPATGKGHHASASTERAARVDLAACEASFAEIMALADPEARQKAFKTWAEGLKGYEKRSAAAHAMARLVRRNEEARELFNQFLSDWGSDSPQSVAQWMNGFDEIQDEILQSAGLDTGTEEGHGEEMDILGEASTAWNAVCEGLAQAEDVDTAVPAATGAPRGQDASWEDSYDTLADRWIEKRGLDASCAESLGIRSSLMRDAIYDHIVAKLAEKSPAHAIEWMSGLEPLDRNWLMSKWSDELGMNPDGISPDGQKDE